jgi:hypothetical protein
VGSIDEGALLPHISWGGTSHSGQLEALAARLARTEREMRPQRLAEHIPGPSHLMLSIIPGILQDVGLEAV